MFTNIGLVDHVNSKLALPTMYMLGTFGRILTDEAITRRINERKCPHTIQNERKIRSGVGRYGFDCVGLIKNYLWEEAPGRVQYNIPRGSDQNVRMMYANVTEKGSMGTMPDILGLLVFTADLGHVGVYVGKKDGINQYVEATPSWGAWGVTTSADRNHPKGHNRQWAYWGKYHLITYVEEPKLELAGFTYTVVRGDTLSRIATKFKTTWQEIYAVNKHQLKSANDIEIGQVLNMPKGAVKPEPPKPQVTYVTHKVVSGDTLSRIAAKYGTTADAIYKLNLDVMQARGINFLRVGWVLKVKSTSTVAKPAPAPQPAPAPTKIFVGDKVRVTGTRYATGQKIPSWVKAITYKVAEVDTRNNRVRLSLINSWVKITDVKKV